MKHPKGTILRWTSDVEPFMIQRSDIIVMREDILYNPHWKPVGKADYTAIKPAADQVWARTNGLHVDAVRIRILEGENVCVEDLCDRFDDRFFTILLPELVDRWSLVKK